MTSTNRKTYARLVTRCGCERRMVLPERLDRVRVPLCEPLAFDAAIDAAPVTVEIREFALVRCATDRYGDYDAEYREVK